VTLTSAQLAKFWDRRWLAGPKSPIFVNYTDQARAIIAQFNLKPMTPAQLQKAGAAVMLSMSAIKPFPGGIPKAHLHFQGDVYLLNSAQWKEYSTLVMKDINVRLSGARSVNMAQLAALSGLASGMT